MSVLIEVTGAIFGGGSGSTECHASRPLPRLNGHSEKAII